MSRFRKIFAFIPLLGPKKSHSLKIGSIIFSCLFSDTIWKERNEEMTHKCSHYLKSVQIWSYFWSVFSRIRSILSVFSPNAEKSGPDLEKSLFWAKNFLIYIILRMIIIFNINPKQLLLTIFYCLSLRTSSEKFNVRI